MVLNIDLTHRLAVENNRYVISRLKEIFQPLFTNSPINTFGYRKFFPDGSYLALCTREDWQEYYFQNIHDPGLAFGQAIAGVPLHKLTFFLWPNIVPTDNILKALWDFDIWNGITVYYKTSKYVESFAFTGNKQNIHLQNFFINNVQLLEEYIKYFKEAATDLTTPDKHNLAKFKNHIDLNFLPLPTNLRDKYEFLGCRSNYLLNEKGHPIKLSKREMDCLELISQGHTAKSAAYTLNISYRTVQTHIQNLKFKTETTCKQNLLKIYRQEAMRKQKDNSFLCS